MFGSTERQEAATWIFFPADIQGGMAGILLEEMFSSNSRGSRSARLWNTRIRYYTSLAQFRKDAFTLSR
jgi:hypothetical protein